MEAHYDANANVHAKNEIPWYDTLNGKMSVSGFRMTYVGRLVTHSMVWTLELLRIAPKVKHLFVLAQGTTRFSVCYFKNVYVGIYPGICAIECYRYVHLLYLILCFAVYLQYWLNIISSIFFFVQLL